jgi:hypothetical protein
MIVPPWIYAVVSANNFVSPSQFRIGRRSLYFEAESEKGASKSEKIVTVLLNSEADAEIADKLHVSICTIARVQQRFAENKATPVSRPRGCPSEMPPELVSEVRVATLGEPCKGSEVLAVHLAQRLGIQISRGTINIIRKLLQVLYKSPRKFPMIKTKQQESRVTVCEYALHGTITWDRDVIILDECRFGLHNDSRQISVQRGAYNEQSFKTIPKHDSSFVVWIGIGLGFKSKLAFADGTRNEERCREMFMNNGICETIKTCFGNHPGYFQQDGAPARRAKAIMQFFHDQGVAGELDETNIASRRKRVTDEYLSASGPSVTARL